MRRTAGFTLIEIMVVVFIIGLLATIVSVNVIGQTDNARITKAKVDLKQIEEGLHLYKLDNAIYPTTGQGLAALVQKPSGGPPLRRYNPEGYIQKIPEDPWGNPYVYLSDGQNFVLKCLGGDGEQGGEGKNADIDSRDLG
jgi:general secretion pathway protein G